METKRIGAALKELARFLVVTLRVFSKCFRRVDGQRAVDENRNGRNSLSVHQLMQHEHDLLRAAHREAWYDDFSAAGGGAADHVGEFLGGLSELLVQAVAVGALDDQVVDR